MATTRKISTDNLLAAVDVLADAHDAATKAPATRKPTPKPAQTAAAAPAPQAVPTTPEPEKKAPRVKLADIEVAGCSAWVTGTKAECTHKTYPSDPHCRTRGCSNDIRACEAHVLLRGGAVQVQEVQQPQAKATRTRRTR